MQIRKSSLLKSAEQVNWLECSSDVHFPNYVKAPPSIRMAKKFLELLITVLF
jgi:hypothetical protein